MLHSFPMFPEPERRFFVCARACVVVLSRRSNRSQQNMCLGKRSHTRMVHLNQLNARFWDVGFLILFWLTLILSLTQIHKHTRQFFGRIFESIERFFFSAFNVHISFVVASNYADHMQWVGDHLAHFWNYLKRSEKNRSCVTEKKLGRKSAV